MDSKGIVYLLQPAELVGTNRYKIGCSGKADLSRVKSYKTGSRYMYIIECCNPFHVENILKKHFQEKFHLIAGQEFFEGDELEMRRTFLHIISEIEFQPQNQTNTIKRPKIQIRGRIKINLRTKIKTETTYLCHICNIMLPNKSHYDNHCMTAYHTRQKNGNANLENKNTRTTKYCCDVCNMTFTKNQNLKNHLLTMRHKTNAKIIQKKNNCCKNCNKEYATHSGLWKHLQKCNQISTVSQ